MIGRITTAIAFVLLPGAAAYGQKYLGQPGADCLRRADRSAEERKEEIDWKGVVRIPCCNNEHDIPEEIQCEINGTQETHVDEHGRPEARDLDGRPLVKNGHEICKKNGESIIDVNWVQDRMEGLGKYIDEPKYTAEVSFRDDRVEGLAKYYYHWIDEKFSRFQHHNVVGIPNFTEFSKLGVPKSPLLYCEVNYRSDRPDGLTKAYYPNGKLMAVYSFQQGELQPERIIFQEDGTLLALTCGSKSIAPEDYRPCGFSGQTAKTQLYPHGNTAYYKVVYYASGKLLQEESHSDEGYSVRVFAHPPDQTTYSEKEFYASGKMYRASEVKDGKREGPMTVYTEDGALQEEDVFGKDFLISYKVYYLNGSPKRLVTRSVEDATRIHMTDYWDDGKVHVEGNYSLSNQYGEPYKDFNYTEDVLSSATPEGTIKTYAENGALESSENYADGQMDGLQIHVTDDNHRIEETYHNGVRASMKRYSASGKLEVSEEYYEDGSRKRTKPN